MLAKSPRSNPIPSYQYLTRELEDQFYCSLDINDNFKIGQVTWNLVVTQERKQSSSLKFYNNNNVCVYIYIYIHISYKPITKTQKSKKFLQDLLIEKQMCSSSKTNVVAFPTTNIINNANRFSFVGQGPATISSISSLQW